MADEDEPKEPDAKRMRLESGAHTSPSLASPSNTDFTLVELNVGKDSGQIFVTSSQTLGRESSLLSQLLSPSLSLGVRRDAAGRIFLDRDPTHFRWILNYLRDGFLAAAPTALQDRLELQQEARFYQLPGILPFIENSPLLGVSDGHNHKDPGTTFLSSRPSSKGIFYIPQMKWSYLGLVAAKDTWEYVGFKFTEGRDDVAILSISLDPSETSVVRRDDIGTSKMMIDRGAKFSFFVGEESTDVLFWFEKSFDRAYPQVFARLSRGSIVFCSRGLDFIHSEEAQTLKE